MSLSVKHFVGPCSAIDNTGKCPATIRYSALKERNSKLQIPLNIDILMRKVCLKFPNRLNVQNLKTYVAYLTYLLALRLFSIHVHCFSASSSDSGPLGCFPNLSSSEFPHNRTVSIIMMSIVDALPGILN